MLYIVEAIEHWLSCII